MNGSIRVLHVDDEPALLDQTKIFLEREEEKLDVTTAQTSKKALELLEKQDFDVIVSDYKMPEMDGLEFLNKIRKERKSDIAFIIFTGKGREEVAMEALNLGADRYLQKGGDPKAQFGVLADAIMHEAMHYKTEKMRKEKKKELKDLKDEYETILKNVQNSVFLIDIEDGEFKFQGLNPRHERLTGLKTEEIRGKTPVEALGKELGEKVKENYRECLKKKEPITYEEELELPEGKKTWLTTLAPVMGGDGVEKIVGSSTDITEQKETEKRLKRAVEIIEKSPVVAYIWKDEESWPVEFFSSNVDKVFGYTKDEFISGKITYEDCIHPDDIERVKREIKKYREAGIKEFEHEPYRIITKDGETRIVKDWKFIEKDPEENKIRYKGTIQDITEEKKIREEKHELDERLKELSYLYSLENIIEDNDRIEDVLSQAVKLIASSWQYPDVAEARITYEDRVFKTEDFKETRWMQKSEIVVKEKEVGKVELSYLEKRPEEVEGPFLKEEVDLINSIASRIGSYIEGKKAQEELKKERRLLRKSEEISDVGGWEYDVKNDEIFWTENLFELHGFTKGEKEGYIEKSLELYPEEYRNRVKEAFEKAVEEGIPYDLEVQFTNADGKEMWIETVGEPIIEDGEVIKVVGTMVDITDIKETEKRFKKIFENLGDPVIIKVLGGENDGRILEANQTMCELLGYSREELEGMNVYDDLIADDPENRTWKEIKEELKEGRRTMFSVKKKKKDGSKVWMEVVAVPLRHQGEDAVLAVNRDIRKRKEKEKELEESEKKFRSYVENSPYGVFVVDSEGNYIEVNEAACEMTGYTEDELCNMKILDFVPLTPRNEAKETFEELLKTGEMRTELPYLKKDGSRNYWIINAVKLSEDRYIGFTVDITKRREAEERGEFLHSLLRHDVQNKTQLVKGYLDLLEEEDVDLPDEAKNYIQKAKKATTLSDEIIEKVKKLKQIKQEDEIGEVEMDSLLDQILTEHKSQLEKEGIDIEVQTSGCKVKGGTLLQETISNLVENSIKHSDCDKIRIQAECEDNECVVTVEDDGKGIPDEAKEKIFERGFKEGENAGSGLGMYLVKEIVESYGGSVEVKDSELGGARFDVHLQRIE
ncbi:MAG: PAS domain S-box protein [Thermoplasmata archaeon]